MSDTTPNPLESPFPLPAAHCATNRYAHCIRSTPYAIEWRWKMPLISRPRYMGSAWLTAADELPTLNGKFASARSRQPTDSHPATGSRKGRDPDDSDTSQCLARALTAQVYDTRSNPHPRVDGRGL